MARAQFQFQEGQCVNPGDPIVCRVLAQVDQVCHHRRRVVDKNA